MCPPLRFEQLCINWCNEKLQEKFTKDVFTTVVKEYEDEGLPLGSIAYADNSNVLTLIEGRMGAISILNEECVRPRGGDESFVSKLYATNGENEGLVKGKRFTKLQVRRGGDGEKRGRIESLRRPMMEIYPIYEMNIICVLHYGCRRSD